MVMYNSLYNNKGNLASLYEDEKKRQAGMKNTTNNFGLGESSLRNFSTGNSTIDNTGGTGDTTLPPPTGGNIGVSGKIDNNGGGVGTGPGDVEQPPPIDPGGPTTPDPGGDPPEPPPGLKPGETMPGTGPGEFTADLLTHPDMGGTPGTYTPTNTIDWKADYNRVLAALNSTNRAAPTLAATTIPTAQSIKPSTINYQDANQWRQQQVQRVDQLKQQMAGQIMSPAQQESLAAAERAKRLAISQAVSTRGLNNPMLARRQAAYQQGQIAQTTAGEREVLRRQEYDQQLAEAAQLNQSIMESDEQTRQRQAELQQQADLTNMGWQNQQQLAQAELTQQQKIAQQQADLQQLAMNEQARQAYYQQLLGIDQAQAEAAMARENLAQQYWYAPQQAQATMAQAKASRNAAVFGQLLGLGGAALAASDKRVKQNIKSASKDIDKFLGRLSDVYKRRQ